MTQATNPRVRAGICRTAVARLALGSLLAGGVALTGTAGLAHAETQVDAVSGTLRAVAFVQPSAGWAAAGGRTDRDYHRGHRDGFRQGTWAGDRDGWEQCTRQPVREVRPPTRPARPNSYTTGFEAGYSKGYRQARAVHLPVITSSPGQEEHQGRARARARPPDDPDAAIPSAGP